MDGSSAVLVPSTGAELVLPRRRGPNSGSFKPGNQASKKNGMQGKSERGSNYLSKRVGHAVNRKIREALAINRIIDPLQLPIVKRWCRHLILHERAWQEIMQAVAEGKPLSSVSSKTVEIYRMTNNAMAAAEQELGWSASSRGALMRDLASAVRDKQVAESQRYLQERYGRPA